jgi:hypothetical protein
MPNTELHNELKQLSGYVYRNNQFEKPKSWIEVGKTESKITGFYAETFARGNDVVISFRGTDMKDKYDISKRDAVSDAMMGAKMLPGQIVNAQKYYEQVQKQFPNSKIMFTGHSLGGSLAQILGSRYGNEVVTFNAYGTGDLASYQVKYIDNITNYGNANDPFFIASINNQIGKTYVMNDYESNEGEANKVAGFNKSLSMQKHEIEHMGDLSKAVPYKGQNLQTEESITLKAAIEESVNLRDVDPDRILTHEEIGELSTEDFSKSKEYINQQVQNGKVMPKAQADEKLQSGDLVWVDGYTRDDGTEVKGYYRKK